MASIFTKELGRVRAHVQSGRKIVSKLSAHCEPLRVVRGRYIEKRWPRIVDAITVQEFASLRQNIYYYDHSLALLRYAHEHTGELQPDDQLWGALIESLRALDAAARQNDDGRTAELRPALFRGTRANILRALGY